MSDFAVRLKSLRKERRMRQKDLANTLGLAQTTIANYEQSIRFPDEAILRGIADYFGISLDFLLGRTEPGSKQPAVEVKDSYMNTRLKQLSDQYLSLLIEGDQNAARDLIFNIHRGGSDIRDIYSRIFEPVLKRTGDLWLLNWISIDQEHFISTATEAFMGDLIAAVKNESSSYIFAAAAAAGELHTIGLRMIVDFMRLEQWETHFLGSNVSTQNIVQSVGSLKPHLLALSASMSYNVEPLVRIIDDIRHSKEPVKIIVGGQAFNHSPGLWQEVGADGQAASAEQTVQLAKYLIQERIE